MSVAEAIRFDRLKKAAVSARSKISALAEAGRAQRIAIRIVDEIGRHGQLPGEIEHGALAGIEFSDPIVEGDHLAELRIARQPRTA